MGTFCRATAAVVALTLLAGCSGEDGEFEKLDTYEVTGTVKMNGAPLAGTMVTFVAKAEGKPPAFGKTDAQGKFSLTTYESGDGAAEGEYAVIFSKSLAATAEASSDEDHDAEKGYTASAMEHAAGSAKEGSDDAIPENYRKPDTTPITKTVGTSDNNFDLVIE